MAAEYNEGAAQLSPRASLSLTLYSFLVNALSKKFFFPDGPTGWRDRQRSQLTSENFGPQLPNNPGPRMFSTQCSVAQLTTFEPMLEGRDTPLPSFSSLFPSQQAVETTASAQNDAGQNSLGLQLDGRYASQ